MRRVDSGVRRRVDKASLRIQLADRERMSNVPVRERASGTASGYTPTLLSINRASMFTCKVACNWCECVWECACVCQMSSVHNTASASCACHFIFTGFCHQANVYTCSTWIGLFSEFLFLVYIKPIQMYSDQWSSHQKRSVVLLWRTVRAVNEGFIGETILSVWRDLSGVFKLTEMYCFECPAKSQEWTRKPSLEVAPTALAQRTWLITN